MNSFLIDLITRPGNNGNRLTDSMGVNVYVLVEVPATAFNHNRTGNKIIFFFLRFNASSEFLLSKEDATLALQRSGLETGTSDIAKAMRSIVGAL